MATPTWEEVKHIRSQPRGQATSSDIKEYTKGKAWEPAAQDLAETYCTWSRRAEAWLMLKIGATEQDKQYQGRGNFPHFVRTKLQPVLDIDSYYADPHGQALSALTSRLKEFKILHERGNHSAYAQHLEGIVQKQLSKITWLEMEDEWQQQEAVQNMFEEGFEPAISAAESLAYQAQKAYS